MEGSSWGSKWGSSSYYSICKFDWLQVYDGGSSYSRTIGGKLCGSNKPSPIISSGNKLLLDWRSDSSTSYSGFKISARVKGKYNSKYFEMTHKHFISVIMSNISPFYS